MLLLEFNRSTLPFVASVIAQCSLVLLLAIPWTVTLSTSIRLPIMLNFHPPKPVEPFKTTHPQNATNNSLPTPNKQIRVFQPPLAKSSNSNPSQLPTVPEIPFDPGTPNTFEAAQVSVTHVELS